MPSTTSDMFDFKCAHCIIDNLQDAVNEVRKPVTVYKGTALCEEHVISIVKALMKMAEQAKVKESLIT